MSSPERKLTAGERASFAENGYLVVPDVFSAAELEALDQEMDRLLPDHGDRSGFRDGWMFDMGEHSPLSRRVSDDERILALIEDLVGPGIAVHSNKLVVKLPQSDVVCHWHQDESFYMRPDDPGTHSRTRMSVWVPLQDADEQNGCLWVVPGSHTWGLQEFTVIDYDTCVRKLIRAEYADEHAVPVPIRAGSVVLFSAWTWHHSKGNTTDQIRRAFITSYQEATLTSGGQDWRILRAAS